MYKWIVTEELCDFCGHAAKWHGNDNCFLCISDSNDPYSGNKHKVMLVIKADNMYAQSGPATIETNGKTHPDEVEMWIECI